MAEVKFNVPIIELIVIDVAAEAHAAGMGDIVPDGAKHDYRLHANTPTGGQITFNRNATAADVAAYWRREGWLPEVNDA